MPPPTPARSSLKGKGPSLSGQRKRNVSFSSDLGLPSTSTSASRRSFEPDNWKPWQDTPSTIRTMRLSHDDDPNDRNYTSTDEEVDKFKDEPYENESSPESEGESEDGIPRIIGNGYGKRFEKGVKNYGEYLEDSYLLEMEEKLGHRRSAFSPARQIRRTPIITSARGLAGQVGPATILRHNIQESMKNLQRKQDQKKSWTNSRKRRIKISNDGSPETQNTPDTQLRKEIEEGKTPDQPLFGGGVPNPRAFGQARRNLYDELWDDTRRTPSGDPPPLPDAGYQAYDPEMDLNNPQIALYNMAFALFIFLGIIAFTNRVEGIQAISNLPKTLSHSLSHPGRIIPGIAGAAIAVPQYIVCSVFSCESTTKNHLKAISIIAADTTLDLTTLKDFSNLVSALGKPLILNIAGSELADKARMETEASRDMAEVQTMENLAQAYLEAHKDLRALITGSQTLIKMTSKKWIDFSGFLTEQIAKEIRADIDLPDGWTLFTTGTRKKHSVKALKARYRTTRKNMAVAYQWFYTATEVNEKVFDTILEQTRAIHKAGIYESRSILKVLEPLAESVREIRRHIAFQAKFFGSNDDILGENTAEDFTFRDLKWKVESLWTSVTMLQDSIPGAYGKKRAKARVH